MRVRVPGDDGAQAECRGEVAQGLVASRVSPAERTLKLHEEAFRAERLRQPRGTVRVVHGEAEARTPGEADEPGGVFGQRLLVEPRLAALHRVRPGEQPAEVRVARRRLDEQRHVRAACERHLRAGDRADAELPTRVRELERAVEPVVVGQRERRIAVLRGREDELLGP